MMIMRGSNDRRCGSNASASSLLAAAPALQHSCCQLFLPCALLCRRSTTSAPHETHRQPMGFCSFPYLCHLSWALVFPFAKTRLHALILSFIFCRNHCDCVFPLFRLGFALPEVMGPLACDIWGSSPLNSVLQ